MSRPSRVRALALPALLVAAGCQDYNFNPVGHCLLQPGSERVTLSDISTADVLFVVDDSGSMLGKQTKLASNFSAFVDNLDLSNQNRQAAGLTPIDFHLAVTTTSVFYNIPSIPPAYCRNDCPGAAGSLVCCNFNGSAPVGPMTVVQKCTGASDTSCQAGSCQNDCVTFLGEYVCCDPTTKIPALNQTVACDTVGDPCGDLLTHYSLTSNPGCTPENAVDGTPYPQGGFVGAGTNPRVIHFDKVMYNCATPPCPNGQGFTVDQLKTFFSQNVLVGTCGSNEEQGLQAGRLAVERALDGNQWDVVNATGQVPGTPVPAAWLHDNSKLVLVFVGDEDDCSSPEDPSKGIILTGTPGADSCVADAALPPDQQKEFPVSSFVDYFTGLAAGQTGQAATEPRPLGAAFIVSARGNGTDVCQDATCVPGICCDTVCTGDPNVCTTDTCGGQAPGTRFLATASSLSSKGADVVAGSICDPDFAAILDRIAEIVKPPTGLLLPTQPADAAVTLLRIVSQDGTTRKTCNGPAPQTLTAAQAEAANYDWWFTATRDQVTDAEQQPTAASRYVFINHATQNCEASPGETYSADYIGRLPQTGCTGATADEADQSCVATLGGRPGDWTCFAGTDGTGACVVPTGTLVGTCLCGPRGGPPDSPGTGNCPNG
ncbi:MAG TPA: hypothetical protein VFG53_21045 [Anaeromyxobacter sp.]|nr:hypothetical protein [Anaeromyxobacter sp.]